MTTPAPVPAPTIGALQRELARRLSAGWGDGPNVTARLDARLLLAFALSVDVGDLPGLEDQSAADDVIARADALANRRAKGEPVARILGEKEFWGLPFLLSPETLVPRPDTETMVEAVLAAIDAAGRRQDRLRIIDFGTGSGCILLALLSELPNAVGYGLDRSHGAMVTARRNAARLGLASRAFFVVGDWVDSVDARFDVVVANPPYVEADALPALPIEVIGHDPRLALDGGSDGLEGHRIILRALPDLLAENGCAALEFGPHQAPLIADEAGAMGLVTQLKRDLAGHDRAILLTIAAADQAAGKNDLENVAGATRV